MSGNVISLFDEDGEASQVFEDDWPSGLPLTFDQIAEFVVLANELAMIEEEEEFKEKQREILAFVEEWGDP